MRFLFLAALLVGCKTVQIKDTRECTPAGVVLAGADCATTNTSQVSQMDFEEFIEWLEPQPERSDPKKPGYFLPARAGAVCRSDEDFTAQKIALEQACALLRDRCTPELKAAMKSVKVTELQQKAKEKKSGFLANQSPL